MNFEKIFCQNVVEYRGSEFMTYYDGEKRVILSNEDYIRKTNAVAATLEKQLDKVEKGTWVGLKVNNSPFWFAVMFALLKIGHKVIFMDPNCSSEALEAFQEQSQMVALVTDKEDKTEGMVVIDYKVLENVCDGEPANVSWEEKIAFCTSGTTGNAKIYVFHAEAVAEQCKNVMDYFLTNPDMVKSRGNRSIYESYVLLTLPFRHCLGFGLTMAMWRAGFPVVMPEKQGIFGITEACINDKIWIVVSVPAIWKGLMQIAKARFGDSSSESMHKLLGDNLTIGVSAGARLNTELAEKLLQTDICFLNGWGMTETGFVSLGKIEKGESLDYVGSYYNNHTAKILTADGEIHDEGCGELLINGKVMHCATLKDGEEVIRNRESFFRTGDIFELKKDRFYFKGRCKSVIINDTGENIYPEELDAHFSFVSNFAEQFCVAEYENEPALFICKNEIDGFEESEEYKSIVDENYKLPLGKRVACVFVTKERFPITSKGETARFFVKSFVENNKDKVKFLKLKK